MSSHLKHTLLSLPVKQCLTQQSIIVVSLCSKAVRRNFLGGDCSRAAGVHNYITSHTEAPTTWSVDCVNQMLSEANTRQKLFVAYSDVAGDVGGDATTCV